MTSPDPHRYLNAADQMLAGAGTLGATAVAEGWWPKACACLIRLALEQAINAYWEAVSPAVAQWSSGRTALLLLRRRIPRDVARQATYTWANLSRATHHHGFEAAIAASELRRLHDSVKAIIPMLSLTTNAPDG